MKFTIEQLIDQIKSFICDNELLSGNFISWTTEESMAIYVLLNWLSKRLDEQKKVLKKKLLDDLEFYGESTDSGGLRHTSSMAIATKQRRDNKIPDLEDLIKVLEVNKISIDEACDKVEVLKVSPSKLRKLIEIGKLDTDELSAITQPDWALLVKPTGEMTSILKSIK